MLRCSLLVFAAFILVMRTAEAQAAQVTWPPLTRLAPSPLYAEALATPLDISPIEQETRDTIARQVEPTHWKEGGIVGAVVLGGLGIWLGNEICQNTDAGQEKGCTAKAILGGGVGGGAIGFLIGALIGGQFPKHPPASPEWPS